jgi:hypothetical protein
MATINHWSLGFSLDAFLSLSDMLQSSGVTERGAISER